MTIEARGLHAHQVLQRDDPNGTDLVLLVDSGGSVEGRVVQGKKTVVKWTKASDGRLLLPGIPTGGPYAVELREGPKRTDISPFFVGDLWLMGGQSNMSGVGLLKDAVDPHPMVQMLGMDDCWQNAKEPVNCQRIAVDEVYRGEDPFVSGKDKTNILKDMVKGTGPGLAFGQALYEATGVPIGLLPCAKGGSSMWEWRSSARNMGGASLYGALLRRFGVAGGKVKGMIWYQGCSDANMADAKKYTRRMMDLVSAFRKDLGAELPVLIVQLNGFYDTGRWNLDVQGWTKIRQLQAQLPQKIKNLSVVSAVDLMLDDGIHISGADQAILGKRLADMAAASVYRLGGKKVSPQIQEISAGKGNRLAGTASGSCAIKVTGVEGQLKSDGRRVLGFSVVDPDGQEVPTIYKSWIHGKDTVVIQTELSEDMLPTHKLYYGYGTTPVCNLIDSRNMAMLAGGPYDLPKT